jgi:murein DD-endopeptidase MepM/ murein hydrolase activator NlpD
VTLRVFPVAAVPGLHYWNDFGEPRNGGRTHQGNDLFAPDGTPVFAVDDGAVRFAVDPIGGPSFYLKAQDGTTYYGTHLSAYEGGARSVRAGDVIAYVGHGGNAAGTPPHLHFEVHPGGGAAVNPYPLLASAERRPPPSSSGGGLMKSPAIAVALAMVVGAGAVALSLRTLRTLPPRRAWR